MGAAVRFKVESKTKPGPESKGRSVPVSRWLKSWVGSSGKTIRLFCVEVDVLPMSGFLQVLEKHGPDKQVTDLDLTDPG